MTARTQVVSDEVWAQLDPRAGALSRTAIRRIVAATALVAIATTAAAALWMSGLIRADIGWSRATGYGSTADPDARTFATDVAIRNNGWTAIQVTGVGADGPGLHLTGFTEPHISTDLGRTVPFTLQPGQTAIVGIAYHVTDCQAVPSGTFPVPVRVKRFWGTQSVDVRVPTGYENAPVEWQRLLADQACRIWNG